MHDQHAEQIKSMALKLQAVSAQTIGPSVHVTFRELGPEAEEVGHATVRVSNRGAYLASFEQSPCARGAAWARRLAPSVAQLDGVGRQGWQRN